MARDEEIAAKGSRDVEEERERLRELGGKGRG